MAENWLNLHKIAFRALLQTYRDPTEQMRAASERFKAFFWYFF